MSLSSTPPRIAVIGCGLGGAALGLLLERAGFPFTIYEQAPEFLRIGAGIHLTPNVTRILDSVGVTEQLLQQGSQPRTFTSRDGRTGEIIAEMPLGEAAREQYGAPYLTVHRGDFHTAMVGRLPGGKIEFGKRLSTVDVTDGPVVLRFTDGTAAEADLVVGADGLSSVVRGQIRGGQPPHFAGQVAYRATVDPRSLSQLPPDDLTKWWLGERFIIGYYLTRERDQYYFVAGRDAASWPEECASMPVSKEELLADFADFPAEARAILQAAKEVCLWPLHEREPDTTWSRGPLVLLGDAGHPMRPHMAQGAAMAIEDAAVLVRCLRAYGAAAGATYDHYQQTRAERVAQVQKVSSENSWMRTPTDPEWVFSYDALLAPLR
ncbi:FAD-dependent monooxygenase [Deinococcus sp. PESE-13]